MILSRRHQKAADRAGGANIMLPWPSGLPSGKPVKPDCERPASAEERVAAEAIVGRACAERDLIIVGVTAVNVRRPKQPKGQEYGPCLAVHIISRRFLPTASGQYLIPDLWPSESSP